MMEFISTKLRSLSSLFSTQINVKSSIKFNRHFYLENTLRILTWNDPYLTWCYFLGSNFIYWFIIQFEIKLLAVTFLIILAFFLQDTLCNNPIIVDKKNDYSEAAEQCFFVVNSVIACLCSLRKENPSVFCLSMSVFFLILSFIARNITGATLMYLILLGMFLLPLGYKQLSLEIKDTIKKTMNSVLVPQDVIEEDELMPFEKNRVDDDGADLESLDTERTAESVTNSLISGISSMPSFLDQDENNEILEEDLLPFSSRDVTPSFVDVSSDSDSDLKEIRFKESHFNKESSSDEGSQFEDGLNFAEDSMDSNPQSERNTVQNFMSYVTSATTKGLHLPSLLGNVLNSTQPPVVERENSSSDSDFEVINPEDINLKI